MSTLAEIEAAVEQLPPTQQEELYAFLATQIEARPKKKASRRKNSRPGLKPPLEWEFPG